ncbi:MAG: pantetheine-phosphate adenylyltransferase [Bacteroidales bacterium]
MDKIAVFPGSFDPLTIGHESVIRRALPLFDKLIIAIGRNTEKKGLFEVDQRLLFIKELFKNESKIEVDSFENLTVDYCKKMNASYLIRGLRTSADFEFERMIALTNKTLECNIETVFMLTDSKHTFITSSIVRDILRYHGDVSQFVPPCICKMIQEYYAK